MNRMEVKIATSTKSTIRCTKSKGNTTTKVTYTLLQLLQTDAYDVHKVLTKMECYYKLGDKWVIGEVNITVEGVYTSLWAGIMAPKYDYIIYKDTISGELYARDVNEFKNFTVEY